jgi:hypothetical protein
MTGENTSKIPQDDSMKDLLEKNLKWSQIIYEQNRKINSKLFWMSVAGWIRLVIIVVPILLALWFLPPVIRDAKGAYDKFFDSKSSSVSSGASLEQILKLLPIDTAGQEQLKALLK